MRLKPSLLLFCSLLASPSIYAAISTPIDVSPEIARESDSASTDSPAKSAMDAFRAGDVEKAVTLATPLAAAGNLDALYLLGFAHESGKGAELSIEKATGYYQKAAAGGQKDAIYRLAFIQLASEKEEDRKAARESLESAAKTDPAVAGRILGEAWLRGRLSKEPDFDKALQWWTTAANANDVPSILLVARLYEGQFGFADKKDAKKSLDAYRKAGELGDASAMTAVGSRLLNGPEASRDEKEGREWLKKAIDQKDYTAFLALGDFEENVKKDPKAALAAYEKGKDVGQIDCTLRAADAYMEGKGTEKDLDRGMRLLETAAKAGSPLAHLRLAANAFSADKPDLLNGYSHLLSASTGGIAEAQNELGLLYLSGKLGTADIPAAAAWFGRAAQSGYAASQNNLATLYERGAGVPQNLQSAGQLYLLAAQQGHGPATLALARWQAQGIGGKADLPKAWALATVAADRGEKGAAPLIKQLEEKLDAKQLEDAKKQLADIKSGKPAAAAAAAKDADKPADEKKAPAKPDAKPTKK
jgi:TPR repeat protein